jgi:proton-coupled amino acid transporter
LVRHIEKFAFTYVFADILIILTAITILVYAGLHIHEKKVWGEGVPLLNTSTWLTMIGTAIYSFEGIGMVLPILEVTEDQKQFPKILLYVMITNVILYSFFGEFCLFVWGSELEGKPLITMLLPEGAFVWTIKAIFSINVMISISLCSFPANSIIESYMYKNYKGNESFKYWLINLQRIIIIAVSVAVCIILGNSLDKFNSLVGTIAATPVAFMVPCILDMKLCSPTKGQLVLDISIIIFSIIVLFICSGFTIITWKD